MQAAGPEKVSWIGGSSVRTEDSRCRGQNPVLPLQGVACLFNKSLSLNLRSVTPTGCGDRSAQPLWMSTWVPPRDGADRRHRANEDPVRRQGMDNSYWVTAWSAQVSSALSTPESVIPD